MKACGYHNMRNRAVGRGHYRPGFKFYEVDLLVRWLRDNGVRFCVADPNYGVCSKDIELNGAPEILIVDVPPKAPGSRGLAIWIAGTRMRKALAEQEQVWVAQMRGIGWECSVNFMAEDALPDLVRLGYLRQVRT